MQKWYITILKLLAFTLRISKYIVNKLHKKILQNIEYCLYLAARCILRKGALSSI